MIGPALVVLMMGVLFTVLAWSLRRMLRRFEDAGRTTTAVVVDVHRRTRKNGHYYAPVLRYTVEGVQYEHETITATGTNDYRIGAPVVIRYRRDDPTSVMLEGDKIPRAVAKAFHVIGILLMVVGSLWALEMLL